MQGLLCFERSRIEDHRGFLSRVFCTEEFAGAGITMSVAQINQTLTHCKGVVRGMHFQLPPFAEMKLVSCIRGQVFDVVVDLRADSPTFLKWHAEILSSENRRALAVPEGFAHGFQSLETECELLYLHSVPYQPKVERGLNACDPRLDIDWPLPIAEISERDRGHAMLTDKFTGVTI
jgi:dTDP-4-dehydrorhamnose 3,5-epimerase